MLIQKNKKGKHTHKQVKAIYIQSNLSTTVTLGTEESGRCGVVPVMGR